MRTGKTLLRSELARHVYKMPAKLSVSMDTILATAMSFHLLNKNCGEIEHNAHATAHGTVSARELAYFIRVCVFPT